MRMEGKNMITLNDDRFNEWNAIRGTSNWQKYELVMDVPSQSKDIAFGIILSNAGEVWVDDIAFEVVSESTELTSTRTPEMIEASSITDVEKFKTAYKYAYKEEVEFRSARLNSLPLAPVNLDFEN